MITKITAAVRAVWADKLRTVAGKPLKYCPGFPEIAGRWDAWWKFEADRPLLLATAKKKVDISWGKAFDLIDNPEEWLAVRRKQVENTHYVGETIPSIRVDIGPVSLAAFLGAPLHLSDTVQTSWQDPIIEDWDDLSRIKFDPSNTWLRKVVELAGITAAHAAGKYAVCLPDISGGMDTLSNLRGPSRLCMDLYDNREQVKQAAMLVVDAWEGAFASLYDVILEQGSGVVQQLGCWSSSSSYIVATCDFNALIGIEDFKEIGLPSMRAEAQRARLGVNHLDGPDAARHAETLAAEPAITAMQYTPGAGTPSAMAKIDMLKMFQKAGKPVYVSCPAHEVEGLIDSLDPKGLAISPGGVETPEQADELMELIQRRF